MTADRPRTRRVLLVEDDAGIRGFVADLLTDEGYEVLQAADGLEGLAALDRWRPDVIVLDLMMPRLDGFGFRARQRARPDVSEVPVIVTSARQPIGPDVAALAPAAVVPKPFDADALVALVGRLVGGGVA